MKRFLSFLADVSALIILCAIWDVWPRASWDSYLRFVVGYGIYALITEVARQLRDNR